jgi:uncharacterized NAD(P)/FAD-binding protein YdhS
MKAAIEKGDCLETVVIIGGGFSGTITAVNLVRLARRPLRVCLVNHDYPLGRGIAYGTKRPEHLLNVAARNMSALADQPNHFIEWLKTRSEFAEVPEAELREQFIQRRVYGDYLQALLFASSTLNSGARIERIDAEAVGIDAQEGCQTVLLEGAQKILADKVVLATGNRPPADLPSADPELEHPRYCKNPWHSFEDRLPGRREAIVLVGTGLTAVDAFLTLEELGWQGPIHAVSRNGLVPLSHFKGIDYPAFPPSDPSRMSLAELRELVQEHCERLRQMGQNPAIVVDRLRPYTQRIWQHFSIEEKCEFYRKHYQLWNVNRHRVAQSIHTRLEKAQKEGRFQVTKGAIKGMEARGEQIAVRIDGGQAVGETELIAGFVLNCTGPTASLVHSDSLLFQDLAAKGLVRADDMDMGISVAPDFAVRGRDGLASTWLYAMGPPLRGTLWETTAVPELRIQAYQVAENLLASLEGAVRQPPTGTMWNVDSVEYCI